MNKPALEAQILRQLVYYPEYRAVAKIVLKPAVFEGQAGLIKYAQIFDYIIKNDPEPQQVFFAFQRPEITLLLLEAELPTYLANSYGSFFVLLELFVKSKVAEIIANFPNDHFREECLIFLNSDVDLFESIETLKNFLAHYQHPGLAAVEEIALVLDEKILKIKQKHRAYLQLQQVACLLELHHPKDAIDALFQPIYDIC